MNYTIKLDCPQFDLTQLPDFKARANSSDQIRPEEGGVSGNEAENKSLEEKS